MKKIFFLIVLTPLLFACNSKNRNQVNSDKTLPRIAICGLAIESSTFSPAQSDIEAFRTRRGDEIYSYYPFMADDSVDRKRAEWFPTLRGHAIPGGIVTREAYETLVNETLEMLKENLPYDGIFFDIHGAMSVVDLDDPEFKIVKEGSVIKVTCPPLKMNVPAIDITKYKAGIVLDSSMWIDEHKMIADEMASFKAKSNATGMELMKNPHIVKLCTDQLRLIVLEVVSGLQMQSDRVEITFGPS